MIDDPMLQVFEIEISCHPVVKTSERFLWYVRLMLKRWSGGYGVCRGTERMFLCAVAQSRKKVLGYFLVSIRVITGTIVDPWSVFQTDYFNAFACFSLFGNFHPYSINSSGDAFFKLTRKVKDARKLLGNICARPPNHSAGRVCFMSDEGMI